MQTHAFGARSFFAEKISETELIIDIFRASAAAVMMMMLKDSESIGSKVYGIVNKIPEGKLPHHLKPP